MLPIHKKLVLVAAVGIVALGLAWYFLIRPQQAQVARQTSQVESKARYLRNYAANAANYPLDVPRLQQLQNDFVTQRNDIEKRLIAVYDRAQAEFEEEFKGAGGDFETYRGIMNDVAPYRDTFSRLEYDLGDEGIVLHPDVLQLSPDDNSPRVYQLVTHLHVIRKLVFLALDNGLNLAVADPIEEGDKTIRPALVTAVRVRAYALDQEREPFVEQYPVKMTVRGDVQSLANFLQDLTGEAHFLPLQHIRVKKADPERSARDLDYNRVEATLVASAFLFTTPRSELESRLTRARGIYEPQWTPGI